MERRANPAMLAALAGMLAMTPQGEVRIGFPKPAPPPSPNGPWTPLDLGPKQTTLGAEVVPESRLPQREPEGERQKLRKWGRDRGLSLAAIMRNPELLERARKDVCS